MECANSAQRINTPTNPANASPPEVSPTVRILSAASWICTGLAEIKASKNLCHKIPVSLFTADFNHAAERDVGNGAAVFVMPSTSARAAAYQRGDKLRFFIELRKLRDELRREAAS